MGAPGKRRCVQHHRRHLGIAGLRRAHADEGAAREMRRIDIMDVGCRDGAVQTGCVKRQMDQHAGIEVPHGRHEDRRPVEPGITDHLGNMLVRQRQAIRAVRWHLAGLETSDHALAAATIAGYGRHSQARVGGNDPGRHQPA